MSREESQALSQTEYMRKYREKLLDAVQDSRSRLDPKIDMLVSGIGDRVLRSRKALNMSQVELSRLAGLNLLVVNLLEKGRAPEPKLRTLLSLEMALQMSPGDLLKENNIYAEGRQGD